MKNKFNKPWKVVYNTHDWRDVPLPKPYSVLNIVDCNGTHILETDIGVYPPDAETAEYIVKCVNERVEGT